MLCSMLARTMPAVISGRIVSESPLSASVKVYISFSTMSVTSPMPRANSLVCSSTGVRTLR
ncbi:Uncharacterised protein [Bordetella pertussis]|nr:Uncharacterised protein [Bordetella pertussis]